MGVRVLIVENETYALDNIVKMLVELRPEWKIVKTTGSIRDTVAFLQGPEGDVQLILLDIELVDGNCFEIFKQIKVMAPIVFTTAYNEYVLKAFEVNSLDYLLKPITLQALSAAFDKFEELYSRESVIDNSEIYNRLLQTLSTHTSSAPRILISTGGRYSYVNIDDVDAFVSEDKCVFVITKCGQKKLTTFETLNEVEQILSPTIFFRLSRAVIANISIIREVNKQFNGKLSVKLATIPEFDNVVVSSARKRAFLSWLGAGKE